MTATETWMEGWLSGDLPEGDLAAFQDWLRADPQHRRRFLAAVALDQDLRSSYRLSRHRPTAWRNWRMWTGALAALLIVGLGLAWVMPEPAVAPKRLPVIARQTDPFDWGGRRSLEGWTLSDSLSVDRAPAPRNPEPRPTNPAVQLIPRINAATDGRMERTGMTVDLIAGAVLLIDTSSTDRTRLILTSGGIGVHLQGALDPSEQPNAPGPVPGLVSALHMLIETPCGELDLAPGSIADVRAVASHRPVGGSDQVVEILVRSGSVTVSVAGATTMPAGSHLRLRRVAGGTVQIDPVPSP